MEAHSAQNQEESPLLAGSSTVIISDLTNQEFLERYAQPGRVGLSGGKTWIDKVITRAERHLDDQERWGQWSHVFLFQGPRIDGHQWLVESDLQLERKHIRMGAQENRMSKYYDEELYSTLAILDFGLNDVQVPALLTEALDLVANRHRYSLRELVGTLIALRNPELRCEENVLARERSMYCSAFVQYLFRKIEIDLAPGVHAKNSTPEDIWRSKLPRVAYVLQRPPLRTKIEAGRVRLRRRIKARVKSLKTRKNPPAAK
ncbi:MAG: hypothetical protein JWM16_5180 [Verrucomicrobiales bacterium]|nr:hypothetical protein [Verrucomicrobiales bacterium]